VVNEDSGMITVTLAITIPQSSDVVVEVFSVDGTAQGSLATCYFQNIDILFVLSFFSWFGLYGSE